ncbi:DUF2231 domain-containing protein [Parasphingopyxis lamellibrachiae]|uniref:Putative membrane protein n=1 Tax=Parasphingopyxis lamellibrachiae TaxID=680125 RepID=A0A3D9FFR3_9SPHN|nr:DUF2231 domain-containing protein [Parasphingopyxis lamellibrachiae]RED16664.1 putative membrane protein [Parasphingopyxis lamellibrachiae]
MVLNRIIIALLAALAFSTAAFSPAFAHRDHNAGTTEAAQSEPIPEPDHSAVEADGGHHAAPAMAGMDESAETPKGFFAKLIDWLGRTHPMIVHFTLALFPTALLAMVVARRRAEWNGTARFLILGAGIAAVPAALLGWFAGGFALTGDDSLLVVHRWLGTGIAIAGTGLALSVWRGWTAASGRAAFASVIIFTAALAVQGWYGGALVHGADHLAW